MFACNLVRKAYQKDRDTADVTTRYSTNGVKYSSIEQIFYNLAYILHRKDSSLCPRRTGTSERSRVTCTPTMYLGFGNNV